MTWTNKAVLAVAGLMLAATQTQAQTGARLPFSSEGDRLVLETLGQRLSFPRPDWVDADAALAEGISTRFVGDGDQSRLEIYKRGEGEAFWSTIYGARVSAPTDMALADFRALVVNVYAQACDPDTVALFQLEPDTDDVIPPLGYVCGSFLDSFTELSGQGEVMVMGFYRTESGLGMVYQEWRGDAFDAANPQSWPISANTVEERMAQFGTEVSLSLVD